jgi:hypothetical protein
MLFSRGVFHPPPPRPTYCRRFHSNLSNDDSALFSRFLHDYATILVESQGRIYSTVHWYSVGMPNFIPPPLLKGQCHEIFCFWFFSWVSFPPAPEDHIRTVLYFLENSRRYSQVKVHHRYQQHQNHNHDGKIGPHLVSWQHYSPSGEGFLHHTLPIDWGSQ